MEVSGVVRQLGPYALLLLLANICLAHQLAKLAAIRTGKRVLEAMGARKRGKSLYSQCMRVVRKYVKNRRGGKKQEGLYEKAAEKMRRSGYYGKQAPVLYLLLKYLAAPAVFLSSLAVNYPDIYPGLAGSIGLYAVVEAVVASNRKRMNMKLQKYMYKIYKYLHNQISSGVRVVDAIRTVYEVVDDKKLRSVLVRLAALYELTLDIDRALEEFSASFDAHEAETLCVVLKQGIETGDNQDLLARQEEVMFKKYFNTIQAETDSCKTRSLMAAVMYTAVVVLMLVIPLLNDTADAVGKIFVN